MTLEIHCVTVDAADPRGLARWWADALGYRVREDDDEDEVAILPPVRGAQPAVLFLRVPDGKVVKNRIHFDLLPGNRDAEVARLEALGATRVDIGQTGDESWVVLADPEGNELCVLEERSQ